MRTRGLAFLLILAPALALTHPTVEMPPDSLRQALLPPTPAETPLRRADVLLFIALPFAILWNTLTQTILNQVVGLRADLLYHRNIGGQSLFVMSERGVRSDVIYIAFSSVLWSGAIAWNDYLETHMPVQADRLQNGPIGFDLHLLRLKF